MVGKLKWTEEWTCHDCGKSLSTQTKKEYIMKRANADTTIAATKLFLCQEHYEARKASEQRG